MTAYLKLITNPRDELAFKRLALLLPASAEKARISCGNFDTDSRKSRHLRPSPSPHPMGRVKASRSKENALAAALSILREVCAKESDAGVGAIRHDDFPTRSPGHPHQRG